MTASEIEDALRLTENGIRSAKDAERWALIAANNDKSGNAQQAWNFAKRTVQDLEKLKRYLQVARSS